jgi:hypothetical protein
LLDGIKAGAEPARGMVHPLPSGKGAGSRSDRSCPEDSSRRPPGEFRPPAPCPVFLPVPERALGVEHEKLSGGASTREVRAEGWPRRGAVHLRRGVQLRAH